MSSSTFPWRCHPARLGLFLASLACITWLGSTEVYVISRIYNLDPAPAMEADFGPQVPELGVEGKLRLADPEDSCQPYTFEDHETDWVALISRQQQLKPLVNCTFDVKVRYAQEAGALAAIVYDDVYESLIIMSKPKGHPDPDIPAVFVTQRTGLVMKKLMELDDDLRVRITPMSAIAWISAALSAFLGLLALMLVVSTFFLMRTWSLWVGDRVTGNAARGGVGAAGGAGAAAPGAGARAQEAGLSPTVLRSLPVVVFEPMGPSRQRSLTFMEAAGSGDKSATDDSSAKHEAAAAGDIEEGGVSAGSSECDLPVGTPKHTKAHAGETKRMCTVCLESYVEGEKVRVLPCLHRFHMDCIDQWLTTRRCCPVCKHDASKPLPGVGPQHEQGQGGSSTGGAAAAGGAGAARGAGGVGGWMGAIRSLFTLPRASGMPSVERQQQQQQQQGGGDVTRDLLEPLLRLQQLQQEILEQEEEQQVRRRQRRQQQGAGGDGLGAGEVPAVGEGEEAGPGAGAGAGAAPGPAAGTSSQPESAIPSGAAAAPPTSLSRPIQIAPVGAGAAAAAAQQEQLGDAEGEITAQDLEVGSAPLPVPTPPPPSAVFPPHMQRQQGGGRGNDGGSRGSSSRARRQRGNGRA